MRLTPKHWHILRTAIFIILAFFVIPEIVPKIALWISPGGLAIPQVRYTSAGLFATLLVIAVIVKNYSKLDEIPKPSIIYTIGFCCFALIALMWFTIFQWARVLDPFRHLLYAWGFYIAGITCLALGILGFGIFKALWKDFAIAASALVGYLGIIFAFEAAQPVTKLSAKIVHYLLKPFFQIHYTIGTQYPILSFEGFTVEIAAACSGIFGIVLFTAIFSFVCWLDREKIKMCKALLLYIPGVAGAFLLNAIRVAALLIVGAKWSRSFAIGGFHSHAGWILFTVYSLIYWFFIYPKILKPEYRKKKEENKKIIHPH